MARSRLAKIGTIHSRTSGLLKAGAMKEEDKPLWFDIYEAFPPKDEPRYDRPESKIPIREIYYEEDIIRAKYQKDHPQLSFFNLKNMNHETETQKFIAAYRQLQRDGIEESVIYETAVLKTASKVFGAKSSEKEEEETDQKQTATKSDGNKTEKINISIEDLLNKT